MNWTSLLATATTVLSFVMFLGIVAWAWSSRRTAAFTEAANAPFALPDEVAAETAAPSKLPLEPRS